MAQALTEPHACARCGTPVPDGARFCPACGAPQSGSQPREERRVVTVLFGDLSGFVELSEQRDAEEIKAIVDGLFARFDQIIASYGGRVDKIIGDEIMAVFGAPQAHEDDPERAVRAAIAMQRELAVRSAELERERGFGLGMHIGINTGEVVAGFVGGSSSYTVLGDAVNTARRIEDAASIGQILVGQPTVEATAGAIEYREVGPVAAKGKRLPVTVCEAVGEKGLPGERAGRKAPLLGREDELAALESLAAIARRDGRPLLVTLMGEAGLGKSRLADEFGRRMSARGVRVLNGRSLPYGTVSPAFALEEMLRAALLLDASWPEQDVADWVAERLRALGIEGEVERVLAFLGLLTPDPPPPPEKLIESARVVLETVARAEGSLVLAFHEVHWAEDTVLDLIQKMVRTARAPIVVLCLARPDLLDRRADWGGVVGSSTLALEPLSRERSAEMLALLAPGLPPSIRETVLDRAGGNPFYIEELARLMAQRPLDGDHGPAIPNTVHALVAARLDALPPSIKRLVQDAAVVGERFWPGALRALGAEDVEEGLASPAVTELVEAGAETIAGEAEHRFRQTLVREVAYGSVPKHLRARQHEQVGSWLEQAADGLSDLVAYHFERAALLAREVGEASPEAEAKARDYLVRAGDHALARDAAITACSFFERALAFPADEQDGLSIRIRFAEALVGSWRHQEARPQLEQALADARRLDDRRAEGRVLRLLADSLRMSGEAARAAEPLVRALSIAREIGDEREEAEALRSHGLLAMQQGEWAESTGWFAQALARWRAQGDRRGQGWSLQNLGWANMLLGRLDESLEALVEGEEIFAAIGDEEGIGWCRGLRGWVQLMRGEVTEAGRIAEDLERDLLYEHPEYTAHAGFVLELQRILRASIQVLRGRLAEATALARTAVTHGDWSDAVWAQALGRYPLFMAALMRGELDEAEEELTLGAQSAERFGDPFYRGGFVYGRAHLALDRGDPQAALDIIVAGLSEGQVGRLWAGSASVRWLHARALRDLGRTEEAISLLLERTGQSSIGLITAARSRALLSLLLLQSGDVDAAREQARAALADAPEEVVARAVALRALGSALHAGGDDVQAETALRDELALLEDSDWEVERVRAYAVLSRVLDGQRRHDEASEMFDKARQAIDAMPKGPVAAALEARLRD